MVTFLGLDLRADIATYASSHMIDFSSFVHPISSSVTITEE